ncbi:MAG: hypothetical protein H6840_08830 [Planctomycetes bacterium]|nr:hypothetical protein [Planctomycetota bacterium]
MAYNPPIAFLLTWSCYGMRLHGDERGTVSEGYNAYGEPFRPPDMILEAYRRDLLSEPPFEIDPKQRGCIVRAIQDAVDWRNWRMFALNIRTNHVHIVVRADDQPGGMMGVLKARCSRALRKGGLIGSRVHVWADGGSKKWLFSRKHVDDACDYVQYRQGPDLPTA